MAGRVFDLPKPVWLFGWVSLATDAASEAIYALLPFFLTQVLGATALSLGLVEGAAEAANSLLKVASGRLADRVRGKRWLVLCGYGLSSAARPLIAITTSWTQVFAVRMLDRTGKGVRGAPRDAMLASWATPATRGTVYGFHRGMDHLGAVVGPVLATLFLLAWPGQYRTLFALTIVPGAIAVGLIFLVPDEIRPLQPPQRVDGSDLAATKPGRGGKALPRRFHLFLGTVALFTLGNSTDAFLLLKLTEAAGGAALIPLLWAGLHVVKSVMSVVGGAWSDRIGRRNVIAIGWLVYALVYGGFAFSTTLPTLVGWFLLYGFYYGLAEGPEKALVADLAPVTRRGTAFGVYNAVSGLGAFAASVMFGAIWKMYGSAAAFGVGAVLALIATTLLCLIVPTHVVEDEPTCVAQG